MNRYGKLLQSFLSDYLLGECNYSLNTKKSYSTTFYLFSVFMKDILNVNPNKIEIEKITKDVIIQFLNWLETSRGYSISTRNQRLACIKSFFKYVQIREVDLFENCAKILNIKAKKAPDKIITYFQEKEIKIIIDYLNNIKDYKKLLIFCVLYETGTRVSELINITLNDLELSENAKIKIIGKGNKERVVPISLDLVKLIKYYLKEYYIQYDENGYLFYSSYKRKYTRQSINKFISSLVKKLHDAYPSLFTQKYSPHSVRHSKATHLYNNDVPLLYIKNFLGHKSLSATEIYTNPDAKKQREKILNNSKSIKIKEKYNNKQKEDLTNWLKNNMK